jgi:hypothetical protein
MITLAKVTDVDFDFSSDDDYELGDNEKQEIKNKVIGKYYIIDEESGDDDLSDQISNQTGWCVNNVHYETKYHSADYIIDSLVSKEIDNMSLKDMQRILSDILEEKYQKYNEEDLIVAVNNYGEILD